MVFLNSFRLLSSNFTKALKFLLYYIAVIALCICAFLPAYFGLKGIISENAKDFNAGGVFSVFNGHLGDGIYAVLNVFFDSVVDSFSTNVALAVYGLFVIFILLPFLVNVGKYTLNVMFYAYMTSGRNVGFWSAYIKSLGKSVLFALTKTFYNLIFVAIVLFVCFGFAQIHNEYFVEHFLALTTFVVLVLLYTLHQTTVLGWSSAIVVFDCSVFVGYRKGLKAVGRHFCKTFFTTGVFFALFWAMIMVFGVYSAVVLVPILTTILVVYDMVAFYTSQGMRFYISKNQIITPKKLEEVDNINKTAFIL